MEFKDPNLAKLSQSVTQKIQIDESLKTHEAISLLEKNHHKILIVLKNNKFFGTLTDGDIRRTLISGKSILQNVLETANKKPVFINNKDLKKKNKIKEIIKKNKNIVYIPLVENKKIVSIYKINRKSQLINTNTPVFVMAGGKGKRLYPITKTLPKPMIKVGGKPMLENLLIFFKSYGFKNYIFSVNYLKSKIINYFKNGNHKQVSIVYLKENKQLGTAGPLSLLKWNDIITNSIIVINCDIDTNFNLYEFLKFHKQSKSQFTIASKPIINTSSYGKIISKKNRVMEIQEKPSEEIYINCGIYIINKECLKLLDFNKKMNMDKFINLLLKKKYRVMRYPIIEHWKDLGQSKNGI